MYPVLRGEGSIKLLDGVYVLPKTCPLRSENNRYEAQGMRVMMMMTVYMTFREAH